MDLFGNNNNKVLSGGRTFKNIENWLNSQKSHAFLMKNLKFQLKLLVIAMRKGKSLKVWSILALTVSWMFIQKERTKATNRNQIREG